MSSHQPSLPAQQQGASLFIALIILLLVTLLAVTSMRGVALEARITGNLLEQKRLTSAAESALRESEKRIANHPAPLDMCPPGGTETTCTQGLAIDYTAFDNATTYSGIDGNTELERNAYWYIRDTGIISSTDPECFLTGKNCVSYYEVNSQATKNTSASDECNTDSLCIRSVIAAIYD